MKSTESRSDLTTSTSVVGGRQAAMRFIMLTVLIDMMSIGLIIPVLPTLIGTFTTNPQEHTFWYGVIAFTFGVANFFGSPILGALSDQYGRRPVLLIGFLGLAISFFGTALSTSLWMLIVIRFISGALQANAAVANAYVADITAPQDRAKRFGMLGAMFGLGFVLGPALGGILGAKHLHLPFYVAGCLAIVNWLYGYFVLPESLKPAQRKPIDWARANPFTALSELKNLKGVGWLVAVIGLGSLAQFTMHTTWVLYTSFKFGWGTEENGWSLFAVGLAAALVQGGLIRIALKRFTAQRLAVIGLISSTICYALWGAATKGWMMYAIIALNLFGFMANASVQSMISNAADEQSQGKTMGSVASLNSLTAVIAPVLGASVLGFVSHLPKGDWRIGLPFYVCAVLQALATVFAVLHFRSTRATAST